MAENQKECENCYWYDAGINNGWCDEREIYVAPDRCCTKCKEKNHEKTNH